MAEPSAAPVLSTPASHMFEEAPQLSTNHVQTLSEEQMCVRYEIDKTIKEIRSAQYRRIALQFPDRMLSHAPRISDLLQRRVAVTEHGESEGRPTPPRFFILGDTSYGACCVDEVAAEHADADVVVHYGRSCLSPTAKLPVIYVFTKAPLHDPNAPFENVQEIFPDKSEKIILMADVTYQYHLPSLFKRMKTAGYANVHCADIEYNPSSLLPNRTVPDDSINMPSKLREWNIFHLSDPPESLLLTLSSRVASIHIHSTDPASDSSTTVSSEVSTHRSLNRRYALLTSIRTVPIFGILINTLSVKNFLQMAEHVKRQIAAAKKKSYTFVVGKLNAAKVANFSEIGAWVVIGCWESSLIDSKDFWKPIVTPFELEMALKADEERTWDGRWISNFQDLLDESGKSENHDGRRDGALPSIDAERPDDPADSDSEPESAPPVFDLRSGRYVSTSTPMEQASIGNHRNEGESRALARREKGELSVIGGTLSPGAQYLREKRTWRGLGSDRNALEEEDSVAVEQGRSGIARGYTHDSSQTPS